MGKKIVSLCLGSALAFSSSVQALTDEEIESRFQKYEEKIEALEKELKRVKTESGSVVYEEDLGKQVARNEKRIDRLNEKVDAKDEDLRINGFLTAGVTMADDDLGTAYNIGDNPSFNADSKAGIQFDYQLGEKASATLQMVARARDADAWNLDVEWAYITYDITDDLAFRMGRMRFPFYMYSETLDVGYTYPWVRPPINVYTTVVTSFTGLDMSYQFRTGGWNHEITGLASAENSTDDTANPNFSTQDIYGLVYLANFNEWTLRAMGMRLGLEGSLTADTGVSAGAVTADSPGFPGTAVGSTVITQPVTITSSISDTLNYYSASGQYDDGTWLVIAEATQLGVQNGTIFGEGDSHYITGARRFGPSMPFLTYSHAYSTNEGDFPWLYNPMISGGTATSSKSRSVALGYRHDLTTQLALTAQWDHFYDIEGGGPFDYGGRGQPPSSDLGDSTNIYTVTLDAVF